MSCDISNIITSPPPRPLQSDSPLFETIMPIQFSFINSDGSVADSGARGGAPPPPSKIENDLELCFVNIHIQYSLIKYGYWSVLEVI